MKILRTAASSSSNRSPGIPSTAPFSSEKSSGRTLRDAISSFACLHVSRARKTASLLDSLETPRACRPSSNKAKESEKVKVQKQSFDFQLSWCVKKINGPDLFIRQPEQIDEILADLVQKNPNCVQARLWLAVLRRICGQNSYADFSSILRDHPQNRIALLNLCVVSLTWIGDILEPGGLSRLKRMRKSALSRVENYLVSFPRDPFARLIECQLLHELGERDDYLWDRLNSLYLDEPHYSAVLSSMAAACAVVMQKESAIDFASEAFDKCPENLQAALLLRRFGKGSLPNLASETDEGGRLYGRNFGSSSMEAIFASPYSIQDPLWQQI